MIRTSALLALLVLLASSANFAHAGDFPGNPDCPSNTDCGPDQNPPQTPAPQPVPPLGFCSGVYEGFYFGDPAPVTFKIDQAGQWGELHVTAWFRGGMVYGQGLCRQVAPWQAAFELYFPGAAVHRGVVNADRGFAVMDGQVDFGPAFRLNRTHF